MHVFEKQSAYILSFAQAPPRATPGSTVFSKCFNFNGSHFVWLHHDWINGLRGGVRKPFLLNQLKTNRQSN